MKKKTFVYTAFALLAMGFSACQKESAMLTFTAQTETGNDKTALNDNLYFEWDDNDEVEIFNTSSHATFSVTPRQDNRIWADLVGQNIGEAPYTAIYPASIATSTVNAVTLPEYQQTTDGNLHNFPMMATSNTNEILFTNLCAAVRISLPQGTAKLQRIEVVADQPISGRCSISNYIDGKPYAVATSDGSKFAALVISNPTANNNDEYCIALPAGTYHDFDIRLYSTEGAVCSKTVTSSDGINLIRNVITTFEFASAEFETERVARLAAHAFSTDNPNNSINPTKIVFHYHSNVTSDKQLQNPNVESEVIYGVMEGDVYHVYTPAHYILAPVDGSDLFSFSNLEAIEFGHYFRTDETTSMNGMFYGDERLTSLDLSTFNTEHVTDMGKLFEGCQSITKLNLTNFSSNSLQRMYKMFQWCLHMTSIEFNSAFTAPEHQSNIGAEVEDLGLSRACLMLGHDANGGCTIHCNTTTMDRLRNYGWGNTNDVHFITTY